jgi:hypothetical protein
VTDYQQDEWYEEDHDDPVYFVSDDGSWYEMVESDPVVLVYLGNENDVDAEAEVFELCFRCGFEVDTNGKCFNPYCTENPDFCEDDGPA